MWTKEKLAELEKASARMDDFVIAYAKMRQLDQDVIHSIARIDGTREMRPDDIRSLVKAAQSVPKLLAALGHLEVNIMQLYAHCAAGAPRPSEIYDDALSTIQKAREQA